MAQSIRIEDYREHLAPLLASFQAERRGILCERNSEEVFADQFGNALDLGHSEKLCFGPPLLKLLGNPALGKVEVEVDKGYLSYSMWRHAESYYIIYESRVNLYGWCGNFTSFVVVPTLEPLIAFVEKLIDDEDI